MHADTLIWKSRFRCAIMAWPVPCIWGTVTARPAPLYIGAPMTARQAPIGDLTQRDRLEAQRPGISFFFDQQHNILVPAARCRNIVAVGVTVGKLSSRQFRRAPALKSAMVTFRLLLPNTKTL